MAPFETVVEPNGVELGECSGGRLLKKPILANLDRRAAGSRWSTLSLALGYIGLVAVLSMAPFLQQAITPHHQQPMVCTDFGGSR